MPHYWLTCFSIHTKVRFFDKLVKEDKRKLARKFKCTIKIFRGGGGEGWWMGRGIAVKDA